MTLQLSAEQSNALDEIQTFLHYDDDQFFGLWGYAGTGKTTIIFEAIKRLSGLSILLCAPTHKATKVLKQKGLKGCEYSTLHRALGLKRDIDDDGNIFFVQDSSKTGLGNYDIVIIDEVSMIGTSLWEQVRISLEDSRTKVIAMGDLAQLPPVNDDESVNDDGINQSPVFTKIAKSFQLVTPQRYSGAIGDYAAAVRSDLNSEQPSPYSKYLGQDDTIRELLARKWLLEWKEQLSRQFEEKLPIDYVKAICYTNSAVEKLNNEARSHLFPEVTDCFHPGDCLTLKQPLVANGVICLSNRSDVTVVEAERINLPISIQLANNNSKEFTIDCWEMLVEDEESRRYSMYCLDLIEPCKNFTKAKNGLFTLAKKEKSKNRWREYYGFVEQFCAVQYAFAITTHSAQGSTYDHAYVAYHDLMRNKNYRERNQLIYTAVTRATQSCILSI